MDKTCRSASRIASALALSALLTSGAFAAPTTTNLTVLPAMLPATGVAVSTATITPVAMDAAPGFAYGSFAHNGGAAKSEIYLTPQSLFGRDIKIGDIVSISYWTKGVAQTGSQLDWALAIYTKPYSGDLSTPAWYGDRYGAEPYFSWDLNAPASTWNQWSSDTGDNQLRFYESTQGAPGANFGGYTDPFWSTFKTSSALSSQPRAGQDVLFISIQTGSAWSSGFTGKLDGLRVELTDGSVANVNFEPYVVATSPDACKKDGWKTLLRADGSAFKNQGGCVSYVNTQK
jgi:hypothetical protein